MTICMFFIYIKEIITKKNTCLFINSQQKVKNHLLNEPIH